MDFSLKPSVCNLVSIFMFYKWFFILFFFSGGVYAAIRSVDPVSVIEQELALKFVSPQDSSFNLKEQEAKALAGDVDAQYLVAMIYQEGELVEKDNKKFLKYIESAARGGHREGQFVFALVFKSNQKEGGINQAFYWLRRSANQGYVKAQYLFGLLLMNPNYSFYDESKAYRWLTRAALQLSARVKFHLAIQYHYGKGHFPEDYQRAYIWYTLSGEGEEGYKVAYAYRAKVKKHLGEEELSQVEGLIQNALKLKN